MNQTQNQGQRNYNEVAAGGSDNQRWEPTKNENNPNYPKQIEGYFKSFKELPGANGSFMVAEVQLMNGDGTLGACVDVSGGKVLENKLREIALGTWIMIQFLGKVKGKLNMYNDWKTFTDDNAVPLHQLMGTPAPVQQFSAPPVQQSVPVQNAPFGGGQQQAFGNAPAFTQPNQQASPFNQSQNPVAPQFGQPQTQAPAFNQAPPAQTQQAWTPPANTGAPQFGSAPAQQQAAPAFNQAPANPFQQQNDDLPF